MLNMYRIYTRIRCSFGGLRGYNFSPHGKKYHTSNMPSNNNKFRCKILFSGLSLSGLSLFGYKYFLKNFENFDVIEDKDIITRLLEKRIKRHVMSNEMNINKLQSKFYNEMYQRFILGKASYIEILMNDDGDYEKEQAVIWLVNYVNTVWKDKCVICLCERNYGTADDWNKVSSEKEVLEEFDRKPPLSLRIYLIDEYYNMLDKERERAKKLREEQCWP